MVNFIASMMFALGTPTQSCDYNTYYCMHHLKSVIYHTLLFDLDKVNVFC